MVVPSVLTRLPSVVQEVEAAAEAVATAADVEVIKLLVVEGEAMAEVEEDTVRMIYSTSVGFANGRRWRRRV